MTRFLLIRHATNNLVGKRFAGRMPGVHLNEEGKAQANDLAERLKHLPIHAIYSSPMERAVETVTPLANLLQQSIITDDALIEVDCGDWTNCEIDAIKNDKQFRLFNSFRSNTRIPGGENLLEVQARVINRFQKLTDKHQDETIVVVSHGDVIRATLLYYAGMPLDFIFRIQISPASVSMLHVFDETACIQLLNHTGKIEFL